MTEKWQSPGVNTYGHRGERNVPGMWGGQEQTERTRMHKQHHGKQGRQRGQGLTRNVILSGTSEISRLTGKGLKLTK